ncbi:hypothetical protein L2E82_34219 [Cichorium intybus]|uniref:Uncharacterized protein n=1 Tax=Cichorium intybus TaxID=13427 RepID=A0ACB9BLS0_CICIN|nr:hypothetical protein L2E82_34219 [Cichorium intybus]
MGKNTLHPVVNLRQSWWMSTMVVLMFITMANQVKSQSSDRNNSLLRMYCRSYKATNEGFYLSNLNTTLSSLRRQLSDPQVYYAFAQASDNDAFVYSFALCREYLSTSECLACFDTAVNNTRACGSADGGNVIYDDCSIRYENYASNFNDAEVILDDNATPTEICGNESTSQPITSFDKEVEELLSDIRVATPRTSTFYVASTRTVETGNTIVYAIAQCVKNISQPICQRKSSKTVMIAGVSGGVGLFLLILALWLWYRQKKKSHNIGEDEPGLQGAQGYSYQELQLATHNFGDEYIIGKGGFGEVFKAIIDDENVVAVKRLHVGYGSAKLEFYNEVNLISNIQHRNLVRQLGWCGEGPELLLVLEYMPQGSLDKFLWGEKKGTLNWEKRFDIIFGIARGLAHLHNEVHVKIIHRDIKSNNILLDDGFQPKIADFGLARFQPEDQTHISTKLAGTLGYMAPEYATHGHLSDKVDTYSFGIVALEIISGRRCTDQNFSGPDTAHLLEHAWQLYEKHMHIELIDEALSKEEYNETNVMRTIEIALMCTQSPASLRPTMSEVVLMLSRGQSLGPGQLIKPTFLDSRKVIHIGGNRLQIK